MKEWNIDILTNSSALPEVPSVNFFHSRQLFLIYEQTPRHSPYMVIAKDGDGTIDACMLAVVRARATWIPPFIYWHCRIYGEGDYRDTLDKDEREQLFGMMLRAITQKMKLRTFYIEVSNLSAKMFGYRHFRHTGYFPVQWMSIHNSLHSKPAEQRIGSKLKRRIDNAIKRGAITEEASGAADVESSNGNAYLRDAAFLRQPSMKLNPDDITLWNAIKKAQNDGCEHIYFLDVGLPFRRNPLREFILRFGGKPVSTYRWFYFTNPWLNRLLKWLYRG